MTVCVLEACPLALPPYRQRVVDEHDEGVAGVLDGADRQDGPGVELLVPGARHDARARLLRGAPQLLALPLAPEHPRRNGTKVAFEKSNLCKRFFTMGQGAGSSVETMRFQAVGQQLDSTCTGPPPQVPAAAVVLGVLQIQQPGEQLAVAVQVAFTLKPFFHLIGSRVETRRFQAVGSLDSTCTQPHLAAAVHVRASHGGAPATGRGVDAHLTLQLDVGVLQVDPRAAPAHRAQARDVGAPAVAVHVMNVKPCFVKLVSHLIGATVEKPGAFRATGKLDSTCTAPTS